MEPIVTRILALIALIAVLLVIAAIPCGGGSCVSSTAS